MDTIMTIDNFAFFFFTYLRYGKSLPAHSNIFNYFPLFMLIVIQFCKFCLDKTGRNMSK